MRHARRWSFASLLAVGLLAGCGGGSSPPPLPTCTDGVKNGAETSTDCGGGTCPRCAPGGGCSAPGDCTSGVCQAGACAAPACTDGVKNGTETAVDCGGGICPACADGRTCAQPSDCLSLACAQGTCRSPDCSDGVRNGSETAVDCGGTCGPCADGLACAQPADCRSGVCSNGTCAVPSCFDGVKNDGETGPDCGGGCTGCVLGGPCATGPDCTSGVCQAGACRVASCGNQAKDAAETDTDCGGPDCAPCAVAKACAVGTDCATQVCQAGSCRPATCASGVKDGDETAIDCGGACGPCPSGSACTMNADCQGGTCAGSVCLESPGEACSGDTQCAAGYCTDGVCCQSRCGGACEACNLPGRAGTCDPIPAGQDPANECPTDAAATCQRSGACSGARSCALYSAGTECSPATCSSALASPADTCNGSGTCVDAGTQSCFPYLCNAGATACLTSCGTNSNCAAGYGCSGGVCKKAQGTTCGSDGECATGFCTDGTCCESRCGGTCEKCNQAGRSGFCDAIPAGQNPDAECSAQAASTCGRSGACSGSRSCALYPAGTACVAPSCATSSSANLTDTCNGVGVCSDGGTQDCTPYACSGATGSCRSSCVVDGDCTSGYLCRSSVCKRQDGGACLGNADCANGACCSSVCRNLAADAGNCGACGTVCQVNAGTASNACVAGSCTPTCNSLWASCNGNPRDGCETPTNTLGDCGGCGVVCGRANATASCTTGACAIASCNTGYDSCDGNSSNGCELSHAAAPTSCPTAVDLGATCGDVQYACGAFNLSCCNSAASLLATQTGTAGGWYRVHVSECSAALLCNGQLDARITLSVPAGIDYDLYAYSDCGTMIGGSTSGAGVAEQIVVSRPDTSANDAFDIWIEVRYFGGSSCSPWSLAVEGKNPL